MAAHIPLWQKKTQANVNKNSMQYLVFATCNEDAVCTENAISI